MILGIIIHQNVSVAVLRKGLNFFCLPQDLLKTREVGEFLSGAFAGAMTKAILAPLETIRLVPAILFCNSL